MRIMKNLTKIIRILTAISLFIVSVCPVTSADEAAEKTQDMPGKIPESVFYGKNKAVVENKNAIEEIGRRLSRNVSSEDDLPEQITVDGRVVSFLYSRDENGIYSVEAKIEDTNISLVLDGDGIHVVLYEFHAGSGGGPNTTHNTYLNYDPSGEFFLSGACGYTELWTENGRVTRKEDYEVIEGEEILTALTVVDGDKKIYTSFKYDDTGAMTCVQTVYSMDDGGAWKPVVQTYSKGYDLENGTIKDKYREKRWEYNTGGIVTSVTDEYFSVKEGRSILEKRRIYHYKFYKNKYVVSKTEDYLFYAGPGEEGRLKTYTSWSYETYKGQVVLKQYIYREYGLSEQDIPAYREERRYRKGEMIGKEKYILIDGKERMTGFTSIKNGKRTDIYIGYNDDGTISDCIEMSKVLNAYGEWVTLEQWHTKEFDTVTKERGNVYLYKKWVYDEGGKETECCVDYYETDDEGRVYLSKTLFMFYDYRETISGELERYVVDIIEVEYTYDPESDEEEVKIFIPVIKKDDGSYERISGGAVRDWNELFSRYFRDAGGSKKDYSDARVFYLNIEEDGAGDDGWNEESAWDKFLDGFFSDKDSDLRDAVRDDYQVKTVQRRSGRVFSSGLDVFERWYHRMDDDETGGFMSGSDPFRSALENDLEDFYLSPQEIKKFIKGIAQGGMIKDIESIMQSVETKSAESLELLKNVHDKYADFCSRFCAKYLKGGGEKLNINISGGSSVSETARLVEQIEKFIEAVKMNKAGLNPAQKEEILKNYGILRKDTEGMMVELRGIHNDVSQMFEKLKDMLDAADSQLSVRITEKGIEILINLKKKKQKINRQKEKDREKPEKKPYPQPEQIS